MDSHGEHWLMGRLLTIALHCLRRLRRLLVLGLAGPYVRSNGGDVESPLRLNQVFEEVLRRLLTGTVDCQHVFRLGRYGRFVNLGQQVPTGSPVECSFEVNHAAHDQHVLGLYQDGSLLARIGIPV